jgi:hypothetical protein
MEEDFEDWSRQDIENAVLDEAEMFWKNIKNYPVIKSEPERGFISHIRTKTAANQDLPTVLVQSEIKDLKVASFKNFCSNFVENI